MESGLAELISTSPDALTVTTSPGIFSAPSIVIFMGRTSIANTEPNEKEGQA